jgi:hypothetical protein
MIDINNGKTRAEQLITENKAKTSRSEGLIRKKLASPIPEISNRMAKSVSDERREIMEMQLESGEFREQGSGFSSRHNTEDQPIKMIQTQAGIVAHSGKNIYKVGTESSVTSSGGGWRGSNDTVRQVPEVYSPLWLNSNLNLPRDRTTINAWSRSFFALNPIVHNAITLHSTYPIAKLNIKAKDPKVEKFFSEMIEELDLMNMCVMAAQEFWTLGEAFIFAELDEYKGKWSRLSILNPDYVNVQRSVIAAEPIISLRPDENLRRVVFGNQPSDIQQKQQLNPSIIEHVRRNENIPINNFYVHHMARRISPYEIRGTGLIVSCFRSLMLMDKLKESKFAQADNFVNPLTLVKIGNQDFRPTPVDLENWRNVFECYDDETEVLTNKGFKLFKDVIDYSEENNIITSKPKQDITVACLNQETEKLEYHKPSKSYVNNYSGEMYHFHNKKIDIKVTPDHDMWVTEKIHEYNSKRFSFGDFKKKKAKDLNLKYYKKNFIITLPNPYCEKTYFEKIELNNCNIEQYNGKIWCFTVPTGLFVTRRNGKITIQGNSAAFDKNFKIFTHDAVTVEPIGFGGAIYNTSEDITQAIKETYIGLMVPSVIMDGSDTTYATGSVALDVLRQRYMQFRQMMSTWLKRKIFAPISQINDFYDYVDGEKTLQVPEVDWNHMSLFDMDSYINNLVNLSQGEGAQKRVSLQTLYRSLGLEYEEEQRKIKYEDIQDAIRIRETAAMSRYSIHELKTLRIGDEIEEPIDEPVPGESPYQPIGGSIPTTPGAGAGIGPVPGAPMPSPIGMGAPSGGGKLPILPM